MNTFNPAQALVVQCDVLSRLSAALKHNTLEITKAGDDASLSRVAWLARNLLKIRIWMEYCVKSPENAIGFYMDYMRDSDDIVKLLSAADLAANPEAKGLVDQFSILRTELDNLLGPGEMDKSYKNVRAAAKDIGPLLSG